MKISAERFNYAKKGNIEGLRCNVLLKFGYNKKITKALTFKLESAAALITDIIVR